MKTIIRLISAERERAPSPQKVTDIKYEFALLFSDAGRESPEIRFICTSNYPSIASATTDAFAQAEEFAAACRKEFAK